MTLTKKISTGAKKRSVILSVQVVVSEFRPLELVVVSMADDLAADNFVPSEKRFREFWKHSDLFIDSILIKISIDVGNGLTKDITYSINTKDPQLSIMSESSSARMGPKTLQRTRVSRLSVMTGLSRVI